MFLISEAFYNVASGASTILRLSGAVSIHIQLNVCVHYILIRVCACVMNWCILMYACMHVSFCADSAVIYAHIYIYMFVYMRIWIVIVNSVIVILLSQLLFSVDRRKFVSIHVCYANCNPNSIYMSIIVNK